MPDMCKKHDSSLSSWQDHAEAPDNAATSQSDPFSPFDEDIDRIFGTINDYSNRFSRMTKNAVGLAHDHQKNFPWCQSRDRDADDLFLGEDVDSFFHRPYQTRSSIAESAVPALEVFKSPFDFSNVFSESSGVTPFGLFAYQGPSPKEYNTCLRKDGVSLWDADGYWKCLFPNRKVPPKFLEYKKKQLAGQIVTKDDFEERARDATPTKNGVIDLGKQGIFFRQFGDFLNWKNTNYESERKLAEQRKDERQRILQCNHRRPNAAVEKKVVGTSLNSSTKTEEGEVVMKEVKTEYFSDGTSVTNRVVRRKPQGADTWASVEEKSEQGNSRLGWFWNSK